LFGINSYLSEDSTFMVDMPHIRFGDEATGYELPASDGSAGQVMATDGSGQLNWVNKYSGWIDDGAVVRLEANSDNVGIGTSSPEYPLHVFQGASGDADVTAMFVHQRQGGGGGVSNIKGLHGRAETNAWYGTKSMYGLYGEGVCTSEGGTGTKNVYGVYAEAFGTSWGLQTAIGGYFTASGAGYNYAAIFDQGNVGIGTSSPSTRLDVAGTAQMTGFKMPTGANSGYVLTSDANGNGTWQAPSPGPATASGGNVAAHAETVDDVSDAAGNVNVKYPGGLFNSTPSLSVTAQFSSGGIGQTGRVIVSNHTQAGFTLNVKDGNGSNWSGNLQIAYVAIE
jgi:hypothetical protein